MKENTSETPTNWKAPPLNKYLSCNTNRTPKKLYKQLEFEHPESPIEKLKDSCTSEEESDRLKSISPSHFARKVSFLSRNDTPMLGSLSRIFQDRVNFKTMEMIKSDKDEGDYEESSNNNIKSENFIIKKTFASKESRENLLQSVKSFEESD
jgi:hypothetical protein